MYHAKLVINVLLLLLTNTQRTFIYPCLDKLFPCLKKKSQYFIEQL